MHFSSKILFDFSSSPRGGGLKRLLEFSRLSMELGVNAHFLLHPSVNESLLPMGLSFEKIPKTVLDKVFSTKQHRQKYAKSHDVLYSYGMPVFKEEFSLSILHLSNMLPFASSAYGHSFKRFLELKYLGYQLKKSYAYSHIVTAESRFSLEFAAVPAHKRKVSLNGADDEIRIWEQGGVADYAGNYAVLLGTAEHKRCLQGYAFWKSQLQMQFPKLKILGLPTDELSQIASDEGVELLGLVPRDQVIGTLRNAGCYLSFTEIENSYNAASEGVFLAKESYLSAIGPHEELLEIIARQACPRIKYDGREYYHVRREEVDIQRLSSWHDVFQEFLNMINDHFKK